VYAASQEQAIDARLFDNVAEIEIVNREKERDREM
jgi:hypothetical protein